MSDEKINTYINSLKDTHSIITIDKYSKKLKNLNKNIDIHNSSEEELWNFVENTPDVKIETKRRTEFTIKGYRRFYELPISYFDEKLKKSNTGLYLNSENPEATVKEVKRLPEDYLQIIEGIENKNHKLLLRLITGYDEILRCDLGTVKISDIVDGVIVIKSTTKTKMRVEIKLKPEDIDLIDFSKEYLIDINCVDRNNGYSKLVRRITKLYFGIEFNQTDLRHIKATELAKSIEHLPVREQQLLLKEQASKRGHSASIAVSHYIDNTEDVNISLQHKKSIKLLMNGEVIHTYNLQDIIKAMELFRMIKEI